MPYLSAIKYLIYIHESWRFAHFRLFVDESRHIGLSRAEFTPEGIEKILDSGKA